MRPTLDTAIAALRKMEDFVAAIADGDADAAIRRSEEAVAGVAEVLRDYGLELAEILPRETCAECNRTCVDYRRVTRAAGAETHTRILCVPCAQEEFARRPSGCVASRGECLQLATRAVTTSAARYGDPGPAFARVAALWSTILGRPVTASEVALCMVAVKVVRLIESPRHLDSWVDVAGYAACGAEVT